MESEPFRKWADTIRDLLTELASQETTYPFDTNELLSPASAGAVALEALRPLYAVCGGASLPDVHNGYFIDSADFLALGVKRGLPNQIGDQHPIEIQVFGSDGGGSLFAVGTVDGAVYYLPSSGAVENNVYFENSVVGVRRISGSVIGFLQRLQSDVEAFVHMREGHVYIERDK